MDVKTIEKSIEASVKLLKALSNERRLRIVCALYEKELNVGELEKIIGLSQSALSQHLARLRHDGLVSTRRDAQTIYYTLSCEATRLMLNGLYKIACQDSKNAK